MKSMIIAAICALAAASGVWGEEPVQQAGEAKFSHQKHQEALNSCKPCHSSEAGGKIEGFDKEGANKLCTECHTDKNSTGNK